MVRRWVAPVSVAAGVAGGLLAAYPLIFPHLLAGVHGYAAGAGYDDGVYFAVAARLVDGDLPYRDFVFVHPPGIAWLMSPIAALGKVIGTRDALVLSRLATVLVAALNCALASFVLRHRGIAASVTAGLVLAAFPGGYSATHTLLLEPWVVLPCLLAFAVLFPDGSMTADVRRLTAAGALVGFACTIKVWAALVLLPLVVCVLVVRRAGAWRFPAGAAAGGLAPCLPFLVVAPGAFFHDVFVAQLDRSATGDGIDAASRLGIMAGVRHFGEPDPLAPVVALSLLIVALFVALVVLRRRVLLHGDWAACSVATVVVVGMFAPVQFYDHYAYFSAGFIALAIGLAVGLIAPLMTRAEERGRRARWVRWAPWVAAGVIAGALAAAGPHGLGGARTYFADATDPGAVIAATIPEGACVVFDDPVLVVVGNRLGNPSGDCPRLVDPFGLWLTEAGGLPRVGGPYSYAFLDRWRKWLEAADFVVLSIPGSSYVPFSPGLTAQFNASYRLVAAQDHAYIYQHIR